MALDIQVVIDCSDPPRLADFWAAALGYVMQPPPPGFDSWEEFAEQIGLPPDLLAAVVDPEGVKPRILFQKVPDPQDGEEPGAPRYRCRTRRRPWQRGT